MLFRTVQVSSLALVTLLSPVAVGDDDQAAVEFFERKIRPVLVNKCYKCHSAQSKDVKGDLLLDTREGIRRGGESGHGVVPGNLGESVVMEALLYESFEMPPNEQLPENVIADFRKWIEMGAPDPRDGKSAPIRREIDFERAREFWAFQPIKVGDAPSVNDTAWPRSAIDQFILASLEAKGLKPVADADPAMLLRRIYFDLTGLPPTPADVDDFLAAANDGQAAAVEYVVDRLLESPQFGERWGRHWLDVVRYAESTGMERNFTYPHAWRYRDYVIDALNRDVPFDRFLTEQIAGDLLTSDDRSERDRQLIATGVLALGPKSLNERNREQFLMDIVDDQIDVTTRAFLGLTASCARCHDHKFDPIPTSEYYALAGIFRSSQTYFGTNRENGNRQAGQLLALGEDGIAAVGVGGGGGRNKAAVKKLENQLKAARKRLATLRQQVAKARNEKAKKAANTRLAQTQKQVARLQKQLKQNGNAGRVEKKDESAGANSLLAMAVRDGNIADTAIRMRGEPNDRGDVVPRGFLTIASGDHTPAIGDNGSGRLEYAKWLTGPDNPLTARVAVNRVWQHLFGRGIVATVNNFGANGDRPSHPELLDHLAAEFVSDGWSVKQLIRTIVLSRTYQLGHFASEQSTGIDPDNRLLWRANHRRLEVEAIRDAMLSASGQLDTQPAEKSAVAEVGDGNVGRRIRPDVFAIGSTKRSVYLPIVRGAVPEILQLFDFPEPSIVSGQRDVTTVPTQALYMMNSEFVIEQALHMSRRLIAEAEMTDDDRTRLAYRLALARGPSADEVTRAAGFIRRTRELLEEKNSEDADVRAWAGFCQTLLASAEFRYVE